MAPPQTLCVPSVRPLKLTPLNPPLVTGYLLQEKFDKFLEILDVGCRPQIFLVFLDGVLQLVAI